MPLAAENISGNKLPVDPDDKLAKPNPGFDEKDQVCTKDIVGLEFDEIVKEITDDNSYNKKHETSPGKLKKQTF